MLSAKLFATLAILQLGLALLESKTGHQSIDVYFHASYFVIAKFHLQILLAVVWVRVPSWSLLSGHRSYIRPPGTATNPVESSEVKVSQSRYRQRVC